MEKFNVLIIQKSISKQLLKEKEQGKIKLNGLKLFSTVGQKTGKDSINNTGIAKVDIKTAIKNNIVTIEKFKFKAEKLQGIYGSFIKSIFLINKQEQHTMNTIKENKEVVLRFNKEFLEGGNAEVLKEIAAVTFTNHTAPANFPTDVSGLIQFVIAIRKGFPDLYIDIHEQIGEGDLVATRKTIHGTHLGEIMGKAPTGKKVSMSVMDFVRLKDGKYVDHWGRNDIMQVIQGL